MNGEMLYNFAFNIIINSVLGFFTVFILIEAILFFLRIQQPRVRAFCRSLPFVKLATDLFLYNFSSWVFANGINPLEAEPGTRMLSAMIGYWNFDPSFFGIPWTGIQLLMKGGFHFTLADLLIFSLDPFWIKCFVSAIFFISALSIGRWLWRLWKGHQYLSKILKRAYPSGRFAYNLKLMHSLVQARIKVVVSDEVEAPCACGFFEKTIIFPSHLIEEFTQDEFEAVLAHEAAHLIWVDSTMRLFCQFISHLFWWIPAKKILKRVELTQEKACDGFIAFFHLSRVALAQALVKTARSIKTGNACLPALSFIEKGKLSDRLNHILNEKHSRGGAVKRVALGLLTGVIMASILYGKFWIF